MHFKYEGEKLAKKLVKRTFADYIIFQNSGAEATEAAIKVAEDIFILSVNHTKTELFVLKILFTEEHLPAIHASGSKKMTEGLDQEFQVLTILSLEITKD